MLECGNLHGIVLIRGCELDNFSGTSIMPILCSPHYYCDNVKTFKMHCIMYL